MTSFATAFQAGLSASEYANKVREMQNAIVDELNRELRDLLPGVTFAWKATRRLRSTSNISMLPQVLQDPFDPYQALIAKKDNTEVEVAELRVDDESEPWSLIVKARANTFVCTDLDELREAVEALLRLPTVAGSLNQLAAQGS